MQIILNLLQGDWFKPVAICCFIFLMWQVSNYIPTEIKGLKQDIKEVKQEIDKNNDAMNKKFDDIYKVLIHIKNK